MDFRESILRLRGLAAAPTPPRKPSTQRLARRAAREACSWLRGSGEMPEEIVIVVPPKYVAEAYVEIAGSRIHGLRPSSNMRDRKSFADGRGQRVTILATGAFAEDVLSKRLGAVPWPCTSLIMVAQHIEIEESARALWPLARCLVLGDPPIGGGAAC